MHDANDAYDANDAQWNGAQTTAPQAPSGLRSTRSSPSAPTQAPPPAFGLESAQPSHAAPAGTSAYAQPQAYHQPPAHGGARHWDPTRPAERPLVQDVGADGGRRTQGVKNIVGGVVLIGIGFLFGGSVFLGNPGVLDWIFDGLGTFWVCKGIYELSTS